MHTELVESLEFTHFLLAFQRIVARRGMPNTVFLQTMQFNSAPSELFMKYGPESSSSRVSVPRAPWWGGWWERMIKVMKISLERSIGLKCLERTRLETALIEVEACINSRPLTFVVDEFSLGHPLSPSHFLVGRGNHLQKVNVSPFVDSSLETNSQKELMEKQRVQFCNRWQNEYLNNYLSLKEEIDMEN